MAIDAGASLVIASGPHVLRGMQFYRHRLIAYSLGNFAGYDNFSTEGDFGMSVILRVTLSAAGRVEHLGLSRPAHRGGSSQCPAEPPSPDRPAVSAGFPGHGGARLAVRVITAPPP